MTSTSSGLTMLTSGMSQYLHPDYIQPLPTTLDAKKSPLALLAQTCSAIGKDASPSKPIIPPLEKRSEDKSDKNSDSESSSSKRPSSRGSKESGRDSKPGFRTFPPKEIPPLVPISSGQSSEKSTISSSHLESTKSSPSSESYLGGGNRNPTPTSSSSMSSSSVPPPPPPSSSSSSSSSSSRPVSRGGVSSHNSNSSSGRRSASRCSTGKGESGNSGSESHHHHSTGSGSGGHGHRSSRDSPLSSAPSSIGSHLPNSTSPSHFKSVSSLPPSSSVMQTSPSLNSSYKQQITHPSLLSAGYPSPAHLAGYPHPLSFMGHGLDPASSAYHSALAAHSNLSSLSAAAAAAQSSALKAAAAASAGAPAALSPFVSYARVRTPSGATTLVPVCRDPLCTNCQLTVQNQHLSATCTAPGCSQCAHEKSLTSLSALGHLGGAGAAAASSLFLPPLSSASSLSNNLNNLSALSSLHSLYNPHSALAAAAHQGLPYICNWVAGNEYCGKRFTCSEELIQHLRSHTASMDAASLAATYSGLGVGGVGGLPSALAAAYPPLVSAPLSPNSLRQAYPNSVSPVSSLLNAQRYHPYKSPLSSVPPPSAAPQAPRGMGPLGPYLSPYTLFGQRIGAAVVP